VLIGVGTVLIAAGYAMSRAGLPAPSAVYWLGMIALVAPVARLAIYAVPDEKQYWSIVVALSVATALVKCMYSPLRLEFPDELQHLRGLTDLLTTGRFGTPNPALPIASDYPGVETVAAMAARVTGVPLEYLAIAFGAFLHVVNTILIAFLLRLFTAATQAALIAVLVFASNGSFVFFNSFFIYENLALTFALVAITCAVLPARGGRHDVFRIAGAGVFSVATVVTHHLTAGFLVLALLACYPYLRTRGSARAAKQALLVAVLAAAFLAAWVLAVAPSTVRYLNPAPSRPLPIRPQGGADLRFGTDPPRWEVALAGVGLIILFVACAGTVISAYRQRSRNWQVVGLFGVLALGGSQVIRLGSARGSEIAGRLSPFLYIGVAVAATYYCCRILRGEAARRRVLAVAGITLAFLGGVAASWPVWWERLPGDTLVATMFERGVDQQEVAAAHWVARHLPSGALVAGDTNAIVEIGTRGRRTAVAGVPNVFYAQRVTPALVDTLRNYSIGWVWVNTALPHTPSSDGVYFGYQGFNGVTAPTRAAIDKFATDRRFDCVYDNGEVRIYRVLPVRR
jgi:hypothetical protein